MFILSLLIVSPYYIRVSDDMKYTMTKKIIHDILETLLNKLVRELKPIILLRDVIFKVSKVKLIFMTTFRY